MTGVVVLVTTGAAISAGVTAMRERSAQPRLAVSAVREDGSTAHAATPSRAGALAVPASNDGRVRLDSVSDSIAAAASSGASTIPPIPPGQASPAAPPAAAPVASVAPLVPAISEGRTELGDSIFALRNGEVVTVHFDTQLGRTRRHDKFDRMVRHTLPRIYGPAADSVLADIPVGGLTSTGDLLEELPNTGIRVALDNGSTLSIWPRVRPGRDGPLVIAYRAVVSR